MEKDFFNLLDLPSARPTSLAGELAGGWTTRKQAGKKGFTLVELMVSMAVFIIVIGVAIGIFSSSIKAQRRSLAIQEVLDQTSYAMEYMSRALRMAKKELGEGCLSVHGLNYEVVSGRLRFINHLPAGPGGTTDDCQEFYLEDGQLKYQKDAAKPSPPPPLDLISSNLRVENFSFDVSGESQEDNIQPRVTMFLRIKGRGLISRPEFKIQTTISQRNIDIKY